MFTACRRGPASISRVLRAASFTPRIPSIRPSPLSLSPRTAGKAAVEARWIHLSSQLRNFAAAQRQERFAEDAEERQPEPPKDVADITRFDQLLEHNLVHPNVVEAITRGMGHKEMTEVQTMTINQGLQGTDIIAQARTGTGKTLGFLLPTIQNILRTDPKLANRSRYGRASSADIRAIIISPTRELAEQIAVEARKLTQNTDLKVQVAVGGNSKREMLKRTQREGCHLLVATPGRLNDLLTDEYSRISAPKLTTLVLDEADRLLDEGFSRDIEDIIALLPDRNVVDRQTLLFSATVPREVMSLVRRTLKPDFSFVQTVKKGDQETHEKVPQKVVTVPGIENMMPALLELCKREIDKAAQPAASESGFLPFKAIVYFSSTSNVELAAEIFENLRSDGGSFRQHPLWPAEVSQMHGQLTQQQRTRVSDRFRRAKSAIMFSTDVTARGMDFPNVSHVIQFGLPPSHDQYIHRVGRTGRGNRAGEAWIFVPKPQLREARRRLGGLPIYPDKSLELSAVDMTQEAQLSASNAKILTQVGDATRMVPRETKVRAYMAYIGQPNGDPQEMINTLNQWTRFGWGWDEPPSVPPGLAQKLGLSRIRGLNVQSRDRRDREQEDDFDELSNHAFGGRSNQYGGDRGARSGGFGGRSTGSSGRSGGSSGRSGGFGGRSAGFGGRPRDYDNSRGRDRGPPRRERSSSKGWGGNQDRSSGSDASF